MRESDLLAHIFERSGSLTRRFDHVIVGPGDDTAVVRTPAGDLLLLGVDQLIESRHFKTGTPLDLIARTVVARSLSDIAAMGGTPMWALATGALPAGFEGGDALFDAMDRWSMHWDCPLVGGDIAATPGPLSLSVAVIGRPDPLRGPVLRSGARQGDVLYVTGTIGGGGGSGGGGVSSERHLRFEPRLAEGAWLCQVLGDRLHAMIDVSDGLGRDAGRLALASGVRVQIEAGRIPLTDETQAPPRAAGEGEDYELLFAACEGVEVPDSCPATGTSVTPIGRIVEGAGCVLVGADGAQTDAGDLGWEHATEPQ